MAAIALEGVVQQTTGNSDLKLSMTYNPLPPNALFSQA